MRLCQKNTQGTSSIALQPDTTIAELQITVGYGTMTHQNLLMYNESLPGVQHNVQTFLKLNIIFMQEKDKKATLNTSLHVHKF